MKKLFVTLSAMLFLLSYTIAQNAQSDLAITGTFRVNSIMPIGKVRVWPVINNTSQSDYKDITYRIGFIAGDGTTEGSQDFILHDYVSPGTSKTLKEQYINCPKDCKSVTLSIVSGKRLH